MSSIADSQIEEIIDMKISSALEYLNTHHLDYTHLIEKGLAIDATGLNIY